MLDSEGPQGQGQRAGSTEILKVQESGQTTTGGELETEDWIEPLLGLFCPWLRYGIWMAGEGR